MMYLKWVLLLVCVALALWPLLARREDAGGKARSAAARRGRETP